MSSAVNNEKAKIFETIACNQGMTEKCRDVLHISCRNNILLVRPLETELLTSKNESTDEIISALPKEVIEELKEMYTEILKKAEAENLISLYFVLLHEAGNTLAIPFYLRRPILMENAKICPRLPSTGV